MRTQPQTRLIAYTKMDKNQVQQALNEIGAPNWLVQKINDSQSTMSDAEMLVEFAGRKCYNSLAPDINPNVEKIRKRSDSYYENILSKGDGSILEHAFVSFYINGISKVLTHELVRHRAGTAFSQESQRYIRYDREHPMYFWVPDLSKFDKYRKDSYSTKGLSDLLFFELGAIAEAYYKLSDKIDWDKLEGMTEKKELTSALRRMLPQGISNAIVFSCNLRAARHIIAMRTNRAAEIEIRIVADQMAKLLLGKYPFIFADFSENALEDGTIEYVPKYVKV